MITINSLLSAARKKWGDNAKTHYSFPTLYIFIVNDYFSNVSTAERKSVFCSQTNIDEDELSLLESIAFVKLLPITIKEFNNEYKFVVNDSRTDHWIPLFDSERWAVKKETVLIDKKPKTLSPKKLSLIFHGFCIFTAIKVDKVVPPCLQ